MLKVDTLFVVDDEYKDTASRVLEKGTRMQEIWNEFLTLSDLITGAQGSLSGSRANAYAAFASLARTYVANRCFDTTTELQGNLKRYVSSIEQADSVLY